MDAEAEPMDAEAEPAPEEGGEEEDADVAAMMEAINLYMEDDVSEGGMHYDEEEPDMRPKGMPEEEEDPEGMYLEEEDPEGMYLEEELVNEVTRRVAKRILGASKKSRRR